MKTDARELVQKAFEMARNSGKADWYRMTTAVLKNRLLSLTKNEFKESLYGATNMLEFVANLGDFVRLDKTSWPPVVVLPGAAEEGQQAASTKYDRIRPDLWQGIMDYRSGVKYVWDPALGVARPQQRDDSTTHVLPTLSVDEDLQWRNAFVQSVFDPLDDVAKNRLAAFTARGVSPRILPPHVLSRWNEYVKSRILARLAAWSKENKISLPERLTVSASRTVRAQGSDNTESLRELILSSVRAMTQDELRLVALPPSAVLRVRRGK